MARINDRKGEWFELWCQCREDIISIMLKNMVSDLENGYNYLGASIRMQKDTLRQYEEDYHNTLDMFKGMTDTEVDRWCFYDMKKRGDIE